jgi:hypothetical protein
MVVDQVVAPAVELVRRGGRPVFKCEKGTVQRVIVGNRPERAEQAGELLGGGLVKDR